MDRCLTNRTHHRTLFSSSFPDTGTSSDQRVLKSCYHGGGDVTQHPIEIIRDFKDMQQQRPFRHYICTSLTRN
ncbi:hypothetical protein D918_05888 [Trichuris suis]|nr:hypothetical protein D918_05888 [Trichuris suis]